jgi:hypothetical protein
VCRREKHDEGMTMGLAGGIALMMGVAGMVTAAPVRAPIFQSNAVMN